MLPGLANACRSAAAGARHRVATLLGGPRARCRLQRRVRRHRLHHPRPDGANPCDRCTSTSAIRHQTPEIAASSRRAVSPQPQDHHDLIPSSTHAGDFNRAGAQPTQPGPPPVLL